MLHTGGGVFLLSLSSAGFFFFEASSHLLYDSMLGVSTDLLHAPDGVFSVLNVSAKFMWLQVVADPLCTKNGSRSYHSGKVMLHVLVNVIIITPLQDCFFEKYRSSFLQGLFSLFRLLAWGKQSYVTFVVVNRKSLWDWSATICWGT